MTPEGQKILEAAKALPEEEQIELVNVLLDGLRDVDEDDLDAEWEAEIARRVEEVKSGRAKLIPWEDVQKELRSRRNSGRSKA